MKLKYYLIALLLTVTFALSLLLFIGPLNTTVYPRVFFVEKGETIRSVANNLFDDGIISSPTLFVAANKFLFSNKVIAGAYSIPSSHGVLSIAYLFSKGDERVTRRVVVVPGLNVYQIADTFKSVYPEFDKEEFIEKGLPYHGRLYPDTYFFSYSVNPSPQLVLRTLLETYDERVGGIEKSYEGKYTWDEILSLAAIVELEANNISVRENVASVLFNRLREDIPLQVDVSFLFINGKNTFSLTREDLKIDDPSNTYKNKGIPPTPIANPGLQSINAVLDPEETSYFYFLADKQGKTYFSETFAEHVEKKNKYLK